MIKIKLKGWLLLLSLTLFCGQLSAASFKCQKGFVSIGDQKATVLLRCGEPLVAEIISGDTEHKVEEWTYPPRQYKGFLRVLRFNGGRLVSITVAEKVD